jgi:outer membrane protein
LERLIAGGLRPNNDIYEVKATLAANEQSLVTAKGNLELARLSLNQSMRIPSDERFDLVIPEIVLAALEDPFQMSSEEVYLVAAALQPSLKNSTLQVDLAGLDEEIAKASMLPSLGLGGSVGTNYSSLGKEVVGEEEVVVTQPIIINDVETDVGFKQTVPQVEDKAYGSQMIDNVTYGYGLSLTVPIYANYRNKASIRRAQIAKENAILTDKNNRDLFRQQIEQAIVDARNSKVQYDAAQASVEASKQSLENLQLSFDQGNVNSFQLNIAADQYNNAQLQSLLAKYDYIFKMKIIDLYMGKKLQF